MEDIIEKIKEYKLFLALTAIGLLLGGYFLFHRSQSSASTIPDLYQSSSSTSSKEKVQTASSKEEKTTTSVSDAPEIITVDVKGAVKQPGVYELRSNSRVHDAIYKAGGMTADANSQSVNLAQKLTDEAVIYVAKEGENVPVLGSSESPATSSAPAEKTGKVHLNRATESELDRIRHWPETCPGHYRLSRSEECFRNRRENTGETKRCFHGGLKTFLFRLSISPLYSYGCILVFINHLGFQSAV